MSEKIHMTFEQACRLAFRSVEIGNTENALAIMAGIGGRIEEIVAERDLLRSEVEELRAEVESRRDEADAERLKRRDLERWLAAVKETLRPWWEGEPGWDGSPCGMPAVVEGVAVRFREVEAELGRLRKVAASLTVAADEAEQLLGDVAAHGSARTDKGRVRKLLGEAIAGANKEQVP